MLVKTKSVVLHTQKYGDTSLISALYTEKKGRISVMVKGIHSKKRKLSPSYFNPLNILDTELYFRPGRNLQQIREVRLLYPYQTIPFNIKKSTIILFLSEILKHTLTEEEKNPSLFLWLQSSLQVLDQMEKDYTDFHLAFLIKLTHYLGFKPQNNYSAEHCFFNFREGTFMPVLLSDQEGLDKSLSALLHAYLETPLGEKVVLPCKDALHDRLLTRILHYYKIHLEGMSAVKSLEVLRTVFHETSDSKS